MPGPKMGPRPADFDESVVRQSPTYQRWLALPNGDRLRYACRDFVKGRLDDDERLMRRVMIARRNNMRDHDALKRARAIIIPPKAMLAKAPPPSRSMAKTTTATIPNDDTNNSMDVTPAPHDQADGNQEHDTSKNMIIKVKEEDQPQPQPQQEEGQKGSLKTKRRNAKVVALDRQVEQEMDVAAVTATRSYKTWQELEDGKEFVYNQKYIKGTPTHDWLLRKNIWRRMRYRRQNRNMVRALLARTGVNQEPSDSVAFSSVTQSHERDVGDGGGHGDDDGQEGVGAGLVDDALLASAAAAVDVVQLIHKSVVDAAVAAAESYVKSNVDNEQMDSV